MAAVRILIVYHTADGQTEKITERVAWALDRQDVDVQIAHADDAPSPDGFDGVIAGDSIHLGRHSRALTRYLERYADELERVPAVALFQVSLSSATDDDEHTIEAHRLLQRILDATGIDPDIVGLFAGAIKFTQYGWLKRHVMKTIARRENADTDTTQDHEYTDWAEVDHFAADTLALVLYHSSI